MIILLAALSMLAQDVLAVLLVQAEARNRATLSAVLDCLMWPAGIACTTVTVTALQGHDRGLQAGVIAAVEVANAVGSYVAIYLGKRWVRDETRERITALETRVASLEGAADEAAAVG